MFAGHLEVRSAVSFKAIVAKDQNAMVIFAIILDTFGGHNCCPLVTTPCLAYLLLVSQAALMHDLTV